MVWPGRSPRLRPALPRGSGNALVTDDELRAILRLQRSFRLTLLIHRKFGANVMCMKDGSASDYGTMMFKKMTTLHKPRPFIVIHDGSLATPISRLLERYWLLPAPEFIITVTGGAQDFVLTQKLRTLFNAGLVKAATSTKAWVITGGTDSGVMKFVGQAMHEYNVDLPLIGIAPWGATNGRRLLAGSKGHNVLYTAGPPSAQGAPLNPHHTHFLLVDSGKSGGEAWGTEIPVRSRLEMLYTNKRVPMVLLIVQARRCARCLHSPRAPKPRPRTASGHPPSPSVAQGGPGTFKTAVGAAEAGVPIVCLIDSGGAAEAIHAYCQHGLDACAPKVCLPDTPWPDRPEEARARPHRRCERRSPCSRGSGRRTRRRAARSSRIFRWRRRCRCCCAAAAAAVAPGLYCCCSRRRSPTSLASS